MLTLTTAEYENTARSLRGAHIARVVYYPLTGGDDGTDVEDWDFGHWHQSTMGVELVTDDAGRFSAVWGSTFGHFGLEVFPDPMARHLGVGEPWGAAAMDTTDHPRWAGIVGRRVLSADIAWCDEGKIRMPIAFRLQSAEATVWLVAGCPAEWPREDAFRLGTDDVMVVFTPELASRIGIPDVAATTEARRP